MWFKNLVVYRLPDNWSVSAAELEDKLAQRSLRPCGSFDMQSRGWVHASAAERYVHTTHGQHLIALGVDQKLLPTSIIRQVAGERAKEIEQQQGYPVGRRQMRELKERVTEELRARALTRRRTTRAWIDPANGWLVIDAAGAPRADELIETLRDTLGSLPVQFLETERSPAASMAAWLMLGDAPLCAPSARRQGDPHAHFGRDVRHTARPHLEGSHCIRADREAAGQAVGVPRDLEGQGGRRGGADRR